MTRGRLSVIASAAAVLCFAVLVSAAPELLEEKVRRQLQTIELEHLKLPKPVSSANIDPALVGATGTQEITVLLKSSPVALVASEMSQPEQLIEHKAKVESEQQDFMSRTGTKENEITCVQTLLNAVFLRVDAAKVKTLAADPAVESIHRVGTREMDLSETVPYIGATKVQDLGFDGTGVKVAVLDTGIDYTHAAFGGKGTTEAFAAAYEDNTKRDGLFPTDAVVEGYDFVGK